MINGKKDIKEVEGLWYFEPDTHEIKHNPRARLIQNLDEYYATSKLGFTPYG